MKTHILLLMLFSLCACAQTDFRYSPDAEDSPYVVVPAGSVLRLNQDIVIPAERARVYMQAGEIKPHKLIDSYYPNCSLLVNEVLDSQQIVKKDEFYIYNVRQTSALAGERLAFLNTGMRGAGDSGPGFSPYVTTLYLRSERQPQVLLLHCEHWEAPSDAEYLSIKQIRKALGNIMTLEIPYSSSAI